MLRRFAGYTCLEIKSESDQVRGPAVFSGVGGRYRFDPDGLPDPGGAVVPGRARLEGPTLVASRLGKIEGIVFRHDGDKLPARCFQRRSDIGPEGSMPALVARYLHIIDPDPRGIIHRAEMEDVAPFVRTKLEFALVPANAVKTGISDAACLRFGRKRNHDRKRPSLYLGRMLELSLIVEKELPATVERCPFFAFELRPGVPKIQRSSPSREIS